MECDICGTKEDLVKVKTEDQDVIYLCRACHATQYEGYEATSDTDWDENNEDDLDEDGEDEEDGFFEDEDDDDLKEKES